MTKVQELTGFLGFSIKKWDFRNFFQNNENVVEIPLKCMSRNTKFLQIIAYKVNHKCMSCMYVLTIGHKCISLAYNIPNVCYLHL